MASASWLSTTAERMALTETSYWCIANMRQVNHRRYDSRWLGENPTSTTTITLIRNGRSSVSGSYCERPNEDGFAFVCLSYIMYLYALRSPSFSFASRKQSMLLFCACMQARRSFWTKNSKRSVCTTNPSSLNLPHVQEAKWAVYTFQNLYHATVNDWQYRYAE